MTTFQHGGRGHSWDAAPLWRHAFLFLSGLLVSLPPCHPPDTKRVLTLGWTHLFLFTFGHWTYLLWGPWTKFLDSVWVCDIFLGCRSFPNHFRTLLSTPSDFEQWVLTLRGPKSIWNSDDHCEPSGQKNVHMSTHIWGPTGNYNLDFYLKHLV